MCGRSLHDVLTDAIHYVRAARLKDREAPSAQAGARTTGRGGKAAQETDEPGGALEVGAVMRDGLFSSDSFFCIEVQMPGWKIVRVGRSAACFFKHAPWGSCVGQSLAHAFVHTEDVGALNAKWAEFSSLREHAPDGMSCTVKVRLLHFQLLRPVTEVEGLGRHFTACEFVSFHLQLIMPPVVRGAQVSSSTRVLVVTSIASTMVVPQGPFRQVDASTEGPWEWQKIYAGGRLRSSGRLIETMNVLSGVYAWDPRYPGCISPGALRQANNGRMTEETAPEVSQIQRAMGVVGGIQRWCMQSLTDLLYSFLQIHSHFSFNDEGVPTIKVHTRIKISSSFVSRWRYVTQIRLDGTPAKFENCQHHAGTVVSLAVLNLHSIPDSNIAAWETRERKHPSTSGQGQDSKLKKEEDYDIGHSSGPKAEERLSRGGGCGGSAGGGRGGHGVEETPQIHILRYSMLHKDKYKLDRASHSQGYEGDVKGSGSRSTHQLVGSPEAGATSICICICMYPFAYT
jgi:hypothetical protein